MATYTTNLNLKKPAASEKVSIADINGNMDTIDSKLAVAQFVKKTISANGSITFTFSGYSAFVVFIVGSSQRLSCIHYGYCSSSGTISDYVAQEADNTLISVSSSSYNYIISNGAGSASTYATVMVLAGSVPT